MTVVALVAQVYSAVKIIIGFSLRRSYITYLYKNIICQRTLSYQIYIIMII